MGVVKEKERIEKEAREKRTLPSNRTGIKSQSFKEFWEDTKNELQKVSWPERSKVVRATMVVIVIVFCSTLFISAVDGLLAKALIVIKGM